MYCVRFNNVNSSTFKFKDYVAMFNISTFNDMKCEVLTKDCSIIWQ